MAVDHYAVLGLPSGLEGTKLTSIEISKAYRSKALELHPDKCPNDPNASSKFQNLTSSYEILTNQTTRHRYDAEIIWKHEQQRQRQREWDAMDEREKKLRQWMEYERLSDRFLWNLMTKK